MKGPVNFHKIENTKEPSWTFNFLILKQLLRLVSYNQRVFYFILHFGANIQQRILDCFSSSYAFDKILNFSTLISKPNSQLGSHLSGWYLQANILYARVTFCSDERGSI